jgi:hypothetical protein
MKQIKQKEQEKNEHLINFLKHKEFSKMINVIDKSLSKKKSPHKNNAHSSNKRNEDVKNKIKVSHKAENKFKTKINVNKVNQINIYNQINRSSSPKDMKKLLSPIEKKTPLDRKPNYLIEFRNQRQNNGNSLQEVYSFSNEKKWENMLNLNNGDNSLIENIDNVKMKADFLELKAKRGEKLLKVNGGIKMNPETGLKVSNYLVESIKAKLAILNKLNKV